MKENQKTLNTQTDPKFKVYVKGEIFTKIPEDFYLPPDALKIVLESFEGPLDLLLYLIRRENIDILELSVSKITDQYMEYINLMKTLQLELAAEYLLMAATLTAIKARMLIPSNEDKEDEEDPRDELIRRLREYERFKKVSLELDDYSRIYRDFFPISELSYKKVVKDEKVAPLDLDNLVTVFNDLLIRHDALNSHDVKKDTISVREKMTFILDGLKNDEFIDFKNVEHRLERVVKVHGIEFINDSKATNVNSTWYALESMTKDTIWIVGGIDKGNDYSSLIPLVNQKVKAIVCLGENVDSIKAAFDNLEIEILFASSMEEAVNQSYAYATKGDAVLLSPACASFDLFENYEHRGHKFKSSVRSV